MVVTKLQRLLIHLGAWLLLIALITSFTGNQRDDKQFWQMVLSTEYIAFFLLFILLFYLNESFLFPEFYLKNKQHYYFLMLLLLFVAVYMLKPFERFIINNGHMEQFRDPEFGPGHPRVSNPFSVDIVSVILFITTWSVGIGVQLFKQWRSSEERAARAEADKANAELSFLKAQINPHFLFNTLNNIYSLASTNSPDTPVAVMKLSNIMRYITDEATQELVSLDSEISCIENYIDLQKMRLNEKTSLQFSKKGNFEGKEIIPLVLMTFVENIFKYGVSNHDRSEIKISCEVSGKELHFFSSNKIFSSTHMVERTGIGLKNTRQRLDYAYGPHYKLDIKTSDDIFQVQLSISLTHYRIWN